MCVVPGTGRVPGSFGELWGVTVRPEHVQVIRDWPLPTTKQELQSFLGFANYHREYIKKIFSGG